jgi:hypothetical protein
MSPLSIASRRLRGNNESIYRSVPLFIDAATNRCCKVDREDDKQTQTIVAQHLVNSAAVRHYSCGHQHLTPPNHFSCTPFMLNKREYHATSRKEILPFIAVGVLGATTVYTYRALEQMDKDWDDYYDKVDEYKAKTGIDPEKEHSTVSKQLDSKKEDKTS